MKRIIGPTLFFLVLTFFWGSANAQIPNPGFESWTGTPPFDTPTGWVTGNLPGLALGITKSTDARTGSFAVRGEVVDVLGIGTYPPYLWGLFPYTQRPGALTGYYKFTSASKDSLVMFVELFKASLLVPVASGEFGTATSVTPYTKFSLPLDYYSPQSPDTAWFWAIIEPGLNDTLHVGTAFVIDDLAFEGTATAVGDGPIRPTSFALEQNYPNPFNPETSIRYDLPEAAFVRLSIYNPLGQEVATLVNEQEPPGSYQVKFNATSLPSGMYFYRLQAVASSVNPAIGSGSSSELGGSGQTFVQTRRLLLLK